MQGRRTRARLDDNRTVSLDVNPLRRIEFLNAIAIAMGRASPEAHHVEEVEDLSAVAEPLSIEAAIAERALILVAEDNPTNRDVIGRQLKMLGYTFEMANDGKLALQEWRRGRASILLTDCHMPEMDGYELAETIRAEEKSVGAARIPIVAITANALQGEAERCIKHGMDDYVSKPIDLKLLRDKLRKWMPHFRPGSRATTLPKRSPIPFAAAPPVEPDVLKALVGDDNEAVRDILQDFVSPSKEIVSEIMTGHAARSADGIRSGAHKLKSAARSVGANALADLCASLEAAGMEGDFDSLDAQIGELEPTLSEVVAYISAL